MPLFNYRCPKCGETFSLERRLYESDADVRCPRCHTQHPERVRKSLLERFYYAFEGSQSDCDSCGARVG